MGDSTTGADGIQDVDSILSDYESKTKPATPAAPDGWDKVVSFIDEAKAEKEARAAEEAKADVENAYKSIKGDFDIDDELAHGFLLSQADRNPDIAKAFDNRKSDPKGWAKALEDVKTKLAEKLSIDQKATKDTNEIVAAMTGKNSTKPKPDQAPDYGKMSDKDFNKTLRDLGI